MVQETMVKVWNRRNTWDTIENIETFCLTVCRNLALDCWLEDLMNAERASCILTQKGFDHFKKKYAKEIEIMLNDIAKQAEEEEIETDRRIDEYLQDAKNNNLICTKLDEDENLPFS